MLYVNQCVKVLVLQQNMGIYGIIAVNDLNKEFNFGHPLLT